MLFSKFSCLLQGMGKYFKEMCLLGTKMKYMLGKHDAWRGAMVWPHRALVKI